MDVSVRVNEQVRVIECTCVVSEEYDTDKGGEGVIFQCAFFELHFPLCGQNAKPLAGRLR